MDESTVDVLDELFQNYADVVVGLNDNKDYAFHFCGADSYPDELEHVTTMETHHKVDWKSSDLEIIKNFVNSEIHLSDSIKQDIKTFGNLWPIVLKQDTYNVDFYGQGLRNWFSLEVQLPGISQKIIELVNGTNLANLALKPDLEGARVRISLANTITNLPERLKNKDVENFASNLKEYSDPPISRHEQYDYVYNQILRELLKQNSDCGHSTEKVCQACGKSYYPQSNPFYIRITGLGFCAQCVQKAMNDDGKFHKENRKKKERTELAIASLTEFVNVTGIIPSSSVKPSKFLIRSPIVANDIGEAASLLKAWVILPRPTEVKDLFPSWAHLLDKAGLLQGTFNAASRGRKTISSCGHLCLSLGERTICEFLNKNGIKHEREPHYPFNGKYNPNSKLRADFIISDTWIEFIGLKGNADYDNRTRNKIKLAKAEGIKLILVEPRQLDSLEDVFKLFLE